MTNELSTPNHFIKVTIVYGNIRIPAFIRADEVYGLNENSNSTTTNIWLKSLASNQRTIVAESPDEVLTLLNNCLQKLTAQKG